MTMLHEIDFCSTGQLFMGIHWLCGFPTPQAHNMVLWYWPEEAVNTLRPRQNGCHFADNTFKGIFLNENVGIFIKISLKFVPKGQIDNISTLVQMMAWRRPGDKPLSEPMMVSLPMHICVTRPQWVKQSGQWFEMTCRSCDVTVTWKPQCKRVCV